MSQLTDNVLVQKHNLIGQCLQGIRQQIETLELIGVHLIDHPINGIVSEYRAFHETVVKAEARHIEFLASKAQAAQAVLTPPPTETEADNISKFPTQVPETEEGPKAE